MIFRFLNFEALFLKFIEYAHNMLSMFCHRFVGDWYVVMISNCEISVAQQGVHDLLKPGRRNFDTKG